MNSDSLANIEMNADELYREETFTDRRVGTITRLTPVSRDGSDDPGRSVIYLGQTQLMTPMGALPLSFEIAADSLATALAQFPQAATTAVEQTMQELQEMRREAASQIVIPGAGELGGVGGPGGRFKLP